MKKILIATVATAAIALSAAASAATPGYIVGGQVGYSKVHANGASNDHGVGYGVFAGYNFDKYFGVEAGLNKISSVKVKTSAGTETDKFYSADLLADAYLPLNDQFELFAKGGIAYVKAKASGVGSGKQHYTRPQLVLGGAYDLNQNFSVDVSYSRIFKQGSQNGSGKYLPNIDLAAVGVTYTFPNEL